MSRQNLIFLFLFICNFYFLLVQGQEIVSDKIPLKAKAFCLSDTRLLDGSAFKHAMDKDAEWLLDLEPDRLLSNFRLNAGLQPKADRYGGWEALGVSGHTLGHYLSACSMMYAASGDKRFKDRVDYIVIELDECQQARKTGYVGAIPNEDKLWDEVSRGDIHYDGFNLNGYWVPWYTQHKIFAGLIDAYLYTDSKQAKEILIKLSDWAVQILSGLNEEQFQNMLTSEFGGMNESLAEVYAITGNKAYLDLAEKFYHKAILDPLKEQRDVLVGLHANTQIPKIVGIARLYELTGKPEYKTIATYFWDRMVNHRTYVNGGNSNHEHLGLPDQLNDQLSPFTSETCNTYNMLKLTKHLYSWYGQAKYIDYYERALYNHILASQNPNDGMVCYSVALESGQEKIFSNRFDAFWCCVGTGIENHVKYAESVFFKSEDGGVYTNLFIPTQLNWKEKGMTVKMETQLPQNNKVQIKFEGKMQSFPLHIRCPEWAKQGLKAFVNGKEKKVTSTPGSYLTIDGKWGSNTELTLEIPMSLYTESMPDNANRRAIFYGPVLLTGALGTEKLKEYDIPVFVTNGGDILKDIKPIEDKSLTFSTGTSTLPNDLQLIPFHKIHGQKHAVYFDVFSPEEWSIKQKEYQKIIEDQKAMDAKTIDVLRIGEMQPERDHDLQSENSIAGDAQGFKFRHAFNGWFSFTAKVDPKESNQMLCTYWGADKDNRNFDIYIDGQFFEAVSLKGEHGNKLFDEVYDIPTSLTQGKEKIEVKFQSKPDNFAGGLFGFRIIRK